MDGDPSNVLKRRQLNPARYGDTDDILVVRETTCRGRVVAETVGHTTAPRRQRVGPSEAADQEKTGDHDT